MEPPPLQDAVLPAAANRRKRRVRLALLAGGLALATCVALVCWVVYDYQQRFEAKWAYADLAELQLSFWNYYEGKYDYPVLTLEQLHQMKVLHAASMQFLGKHLVSYKPFSSADPDSVEALTVKIYGEQVKLTKGDLVKRDETSLERDAP
jgi:hypothetical protein